MTATAHPLFSVTAIVAGCLMVTAGAPAADLGSSLDELFGRGADGRAMAPEPVWRPGHETVVWIDESTHGAAALIEFDPSSGDRRTLVDPAAWRRIWAQRGHGAPDLARLVWRPDGEAFVIAGDDLTVLVDLPIRKPTVLDAGFEPEEHAVFAPDGRRIAWVRGHDLWVYDVKAEREIRVTEDGSDTVFNGVFDWVYTEELAARDGRAFAWSDDGSKLAWLRLDDSTVPIHHLVDVMATHSRITGQRYPKPGDPSPVPSLHAVTFGDGPEPARRIDIDVGRPVPYIPRFGFTPDGDLWYQKLDRAQERLELVRLDPADVASGSVVVEEADRFWVEPVEALHFLDDGSLLWLSPRSGHRHLHRLRSDGADIDLTPGPWDVTELIGVDPAGRFAWVQAARPTPRERRLYRIELATGATVELTTTPGSHTGRLSSSAQRLLVTSSSAGTPPRRRVVDGDGSGAAEVPVEHPIPSIGLADSRFVQVTADDGVALDAMLLLPPGFDAEQRFPVVVFVYGGPRAQVVLDRWPSTSGFFNHALAGAGFVVFAVDNRGASARGRAFESAVDHALGSAQLPDQLAGVAWLRAQDWVDPDHIGIWGWSYGGYMAAYALTRSPGTFAAGAAIAPVTDWRLYDSIYTERYMATPQDNPEGYAAGSVLEAVGALADPLLVIHGTSDDNVHVQHTLQLADRSWRSGVRFDLMLMPNLDHRLDDGASRRQVFGAVGDFFTSHLGACTE